MTQSQEQNILGVQETRKSTTQNVWVAKWIPEISIAAASITTSFGSSYSLGTQGLVAIKFFNGTNEAVSLSFDGTNTNLTLQAGETFSQDYLNNIRVSSLLFWVKASVAPTTGNLIINGFW